ncbi:hypothetical protein GALMADRAFT_256849 [Galerina marginata CBS 339.88]|uniref:F-box domain-containing protein n=1 Tax=Galerina marginata (strain CBS 339.88) TaxID=685588 RepID=A0A067SCG5_GALM3|nr:hypothetical protein GALMADRAFT_256849 [Galerina marginata CBS 339.88]
MASIHKLHTDILWSIFTFNTGPPLTSTSSRNIENCLRPLTVTRQSSQVCRSWRQILLQSSSLWGRLIDLNQLGQKNRLWADEVVRRSGFALLWIYGDMHPQGSMEANEDFFFSVLDRIERIQILEVEVQDGVDHNDQGWDILLRPAPCLQFFKLSYSQPLLQNSQRPIFANRAPSLLSFDTHQVPFAIDAPWLSHIRDIRFPLEFTIRQVLELCCRMPHLETFHPSDSFDINMVFIEPLPRMHLPFLSSIQLTTGLVNALTFLDHITPAPGCSLSLHTNDGIRVTAHVTPRMLETAPSILSRRMVDYFSYHAPTRIRVEFTPVALSFLDVSYRPDDSDCKFVIQLSPWYARNRTGHVLLSQAFLFPPASLACLVSVKEVELFLYDIHPTMYPGLRSILQACHSVNKIAISFDSISYLTGIETLSDRILYSCLQNLSDRIIFPHLQTLQVDLDKGYNHEVIDMAKFLRFLKKYRDNGSPLSLLKLTDYQEEDPLNIDALNEMADLTVQWMSGEEVVESVGGRRT